MSSHRIHPSINDPLPANFRQLGDRNRGPQHRNDAPTQWPPSLQDHQVAYNIEEAERGAYMGHNGDTRYVTTPPASAPYSTLLTTPLARLNLPSDQETEQWLRNYLKIPAPQSLNLWILPDLTNLRKLPNLTDTIFLAIWGSPYKRLGLAEIYTAIENRYPALITYTDKAWQRSIRHRLSLKACFVRIPRDRRGADWVLDVSKGLQNCRSYRPSPSHKAGGSSSNHPSYSVDDVAYQALGYSSDSEGFLTPSPEISTVFNNYTAVNLDSYHDHTEGRTGDIFPH